MCSAILCGDILLHPLLIIGRELRSEERLGYPYSPSISYSTRSRLELLRDRKSPRQWTFLHFLDDFYWDFAGRNCGCFVSSEWVISGSFLDADGFDTMISEVQIVMTERQVRSVLAVSLDFYVPCIIIYIYIYICIPYNVMYIMIYTRIIIHVYVCTYIHIIYIYIYTCTYIYIYIYICTYVHMSTCMFIYVYIYIYIPQNPSLHAPYWKPPTSFPKVMRYLCV